MRAREYDPLLARFLQPDPKGQQGDPHPYAYANHNPLRYTDPTGTSYVDFFGGRRSFYDDRGIFRNDYVQENMNRINARFEQTSRDMWNTVNISRSISSSGSGGIAQTSFNLNWNGGGMNGFVSPYANIGAGPAVGVPPVQLKDNSKEMLFMTGTSIDITKNTIVNNDRWLGLNGKYNSMDWGGNLYTGARSAATSTGAAMEFAGSGVFYASTGVNLYDGLNYFKNNNYSGVLESATNIGVDIGAWRIGGWPGVSLGVGYAITSDFYDNYMWSREY